VVVVRIDPQTIERSRRSPSVVTPIDVAATKDAIWVSVADPDTALRIAGR
jgi:hypothetical protein